MSAATVEVPTRSAAGTKRKVQHWFRAKELERAHDVGGLVLLAYCGRPELCGKPGPPSVIVPVVGGLMAVNGPKDCKSCVRAYEAALRRDARRRGRWNEVNGF